MDSRTQEAKKKRADYEMSQAQEAQMNSDYSAPTLCGSLNQLFDTRHNIERYVFGISQQMLTLGFCNQKDLYEENTGDDKSSSHTAVQRLAEEVYELNVSADRLKILLDFMLKQYPQ